MLTLKQAYYDTPSSPDEAAEMLALVREDNRRGIRRTREYPTPDPLYVGFVNSRIAFLRGAAVFSASGGGV